MAYQGLSLTGGRSDLWRRLCLDPLGPRGGEGPDPLGPRGGEGPDPLGPRGGEGPDPPSSTETQPRG